MTRRIESRIRARALQLLYALDVTPTESVNAAASGVGRLTGQALLVHEHVAPMVEAIRKRQGELDARAAAAALHWRLERMAMVERNILRIGIYELEERLAPPKVVIDEAVWLAHRFAGPRAAPFINGVLDRIARDLGLLGDP